MPAPQARMIIIYHNYKVSLRFNFLNFFVQVINVVKVLAHSQRGVTNWMSRAIGALNQTLNYFGLAIVDNRALVEVRVVVTIQLIMINMHYGLNIMLYYKWFSASVMRTSCYLAYKIVVRDSSFPN